MGMGRILSIWKEKKHRGGLLMLAAVLAGGAQAGGPAPGCFERSYSADHLARHPEQVVERIVLQILTNGENTAARLWVNTARQGHARAEGLGGQRFAQVLECWDDADGRGFCAVECDGGNFTVTKRDAKSLTFETKYLMVGDTEECGGAVDLAERPRELVTYRLNAAADAICAAEY